MHEGAALGWRELVEKHQAALTQDIAARLDSQIRSAVSQAIEAERAAGIEQADRVRRETREGAVRSTAESLNQTLRRLRQTSSPEEIFELLADASSPYAVKAVVLSLENHHFRSAASRGLRPDGSLDQVSFPATASPAAASAIQSKDLVVTFVSPGELSSELTKAFEAEEDQKAYLFPILERQSVVAMLAVTGNVAPAPLELLCEAAGLKLEAFAAEKRAESVLKPLPDPELVRIETPAPTAGPVKRTWHDLSAEDQKLHLQAQRIARVRVAELRLYHADTLRDGVQAANIYLALKPQLDAARTEFLQTYLSKSPTMVDYLHMEILRSLAHDDDRLLGQTYPGPMV